jgi:2-polyprenyl-3-methyl-5-hydroxy-6-metoxy-1,4-benzoquinol methylase
MSFIENLKIQPDQLSERKNCVTCETGELKHHRTINQFPVYMGTTNKSRKDDLFADQIWGECQNCGCLQLQQLLPLDILYSENHSSGAVGQMWVRHHLEFAKFIVRNEPTEILEIGAAHGILARNILQIKPNMKYAIIEPSPSSIPSEVTLIQDYIENRLDLVARAKVIVHSHLIEHLYEPAKFIRNLGELIPQNSYMYISFPNIEKLIKTGGTNSLNFEHTYYLYPSQLQYILEKNSFLVEELTSFEEHSYFIRCRKTNNLRADNNIPNITKFIEDFDRMWDNLNLLVKKLNEISIEPKGKIFLFGAHVFSQGLISLGLNLTHISGVIDNAPEKQGQRLYGTDLLVFSPEIVRGVQNCTVILKASHYQEEIKSQLLAINPSVCIIE